MQAEFWHERWQAGQLGFHEGKPNALLVAQFQRLGLVTGDRVFLPLCGKTRDIAWLLAQGCRVAGAELSEIAIRDLFEDLKITPEIEDLGTLKAYRAPGIDIFVGDIFDLTAGTLGPVDAVYDRAAFVALPEEIRVRYAPHLSVLTGRAPQLLITFDYDQSVMAGPPFSTPAAEVHARYAALYRVNALDSVPVAGKLKGTAEADEIIWHLTPA